MYCMYEALQHCSTIVTSYADQLQIEGFNGSQKLGQYGWTIPKIFIWLAWPSLGFGSPLIFTSRSYMYMYTLISKSLYFE